VYVLSSSIPYGRGGGARARRHDTGKLDPKMRALVRLAAYVALDASALAYKRAVEVAVRSGASPDEMVGVLFAVASVVGVARVVSVAPKLASAMGFDVDRAMEYLITTATEATGSP
jgi:alkylhydroperoxidase/carboxymuconolactone decarboxylase family protein YurZ